MENRAWVLGKSLANKVRTEGTRIRQPLRLILQCFCAIFNSMIKVSQSCNSLQNNLCFLNDSPSICSLSKVVDLILKSNLALVSEGIYARNIRTCKSTEISLLLN